MEGRIKIKDLKKNLEEFSDDDYLVIEASDELLWVVLMTEDDDGPNSKTKQIYEDHVEIEYCDDL